MLKIRLQRVGRKNDPSFRVVVTEHSTAAKKPGSFLEILGSYDPRKDVHTIHADRVKYWIERGAQLSGTVHNLLITAGIISGKKINILPKKTVLVKVEEAAPAVTPITGDSVEVPAETEEEGEVAPVVEAGETV